MNIKDIKPSGEITPFIFLGEILVPKGIDFPIEIANNSILKRADIKTVEIIKRHLEPYIQENFHNIINPYESRVIPLQDGGFTFDRLLNYDDWQYWVLEHSNYLFEENLTISIELSDIGLTPLFEVCGSQGYSGSFNSLAVANFLNVMPNHKQKEITFELVNNIKKTRAILDSFSEIPTREYPEIRKALKDFIDLKDIPKNSPFQIVGILSIIELLLAHNPKKSSSSSINNQLQSKIKLLNNRFDSKIDFRTHFNAPDTLTEEKVIEKLYEYRSDIAHGDFSDFESSLQILNNKDKVYKFLHMLVRKLIVQSLKEPQLVCDLKKC